MDYYADLYSSDTGCAAYAKTHKQLTVVAKQYLAVPCIDVCSTAVADDDLRLVEQLEASQQECNGDEGQGSSQDSRAGGLLDSKQGNHDDLEEERGSDDVLEDLHPHLQQASMCSVSCTVKQSATRIMLLGGQVSGELSGVCRHAIV